MISLFMPLILGFTVIASVSLGIITAYAAVIGILQAVGGTSRTEAAPHRPRLVLVPTETHASGD